MSALPPRASLFPAGSLAPATAKSLWADFYDAIANFLGSDGDGFDGALLAAPRRVTLGGTADAITSTLAPAPAAYVTGMRVTGLLPGANTIVAPTMNLNALGAKTIKKRSGTGAKVALVVGDYNGTLPFEFEYDGTDMILLNPLVPARASVASAATLDLSATSGNLLITGTTAVTAVTLASGQTRYATADAALPLTHGASLIVQGGVSYTCEAGDLLIFIGEPAGVVRVIIGKTNGQPLANATGRPSRRQTVLSGPVDANGLPDFGGATGSTTVTATGTLRVTAAAGGDADYTGDIVNPAWTGLSTNGTMYLYCDVSAAGVVSTGSCTLAPAYQWGGAYSTTSGQHTYNIQEGTMKVGNGAAATQVYRSFVGEVTVAGNVVTAITWYALAARYLGAWTATLPNAATAISANHNIGITPQSCLLSVECTTADVGYAVGDRVTASNFMSDTSAQSRVMNLWASPTAIGFTTGTTANIGLYNKTTGANASPTVASWKYRLEADRGW